MFISECLGKPLLLQIKVLWPQQIARIKPRLEKIIPIKIPGRWQDLFYKRKGVPSQPKMTGGTKAASDFSPYIPVDAPFCSSTQVGWPWFSFGKNLTKFWIILPNLLFASLPRCLRCILTSLAPPLHILKASAKLTWKCERRQNKLKKIEV